MDRSLRAIARIAEEGGEAPPLQLLTGNFLVIGQPTSQRAFAEAWAEAASKVDLQRMHPRRKDRDSVWKEIHAKAEAMLEPVRRSSSDGELDAICFAPARAVFMSTSEAGDMPCLRVPLDQVEAWWGGEVKWKQGGGPGFFVGGLFPLDF